MNLESKQERTTRNVQLVETANIARSLARLKKTYRWDDKVLKRAVLNAAQIANVFSNETETAIRMAFKLP